MTKDNPLKIEYFTLVPSSLIEFFDHWGLWKPFWFALDCVRTSFPNIQGVSISLVTDPECGEQWVQIRFETEGTVEEILEANKGYMRKYVDGGSSDFDQRMRIRLMYGIK